MQRATVDLPEPDSPTMPEGLAAPHLERDVLRRRAPRGRGRASRRAIDLGEPHGAQHAVAPRHRAARWCGARLGTAAISMRV